MSTIDCVIVGYNDMPLATLASQHKILQRHSGTYTELRTNSVLLDGRRISYMDLLNTMIKQTHGVNPNLNAFEAPNLGGAYLTSFLRRRGFRAELVNFYNFERDRLRDLLEDSPRAVAITTTYYVEEEPIREIIEFIRSNQPDAIIILGGPYIYNVYAANNIEVQDMIFRSLDADIYITDAQGEATLAWVLGCLKSNGGRGLGLIPNLAYRSGRSILRTLRREEANNLDENSIDWKLFDPTFFTPTTYVRTARSCPFKCAFCNYPSMSGQHTFADVDTVRAELRYLADCGVEFVIFVDDTFNVPLPRFKKLCRMMIEERLGLKWISFFRCSNTDEECFDLMQRSGCLGVYLGIESGDDEMLKRMDKFADVQKYREAIRRLHERDILTFASFIAGYPGETQASVMRTIEFIEEVAPSFYNIQLYFHDPLSPVNQKRTLYGIRGNHYSWSHQTMNWEEATEWVEYALQNVTNSVPLALYGFSLWSIPYLMQNGFSLDQIKAFARIARRMLIKGLDDFEDDYDQEQEEMGTVLCGWDSSLRRRNAPGSLVSIATR